MPYPDNTLTRVRRELDTLGFTIRRSEAWRGPVIFRDVGALIYFLKAIPWVIRGFDPERHPEVLNALQARVDRGEDLEFTYTRFLVEAVKG